MGVDDKFAIVKHFDVLHLRNLLHLQSGLAELQKRLDACDDAQTIQLNLDWRRQTLRQHTRDPKIFLLKPERLSKVEIILTAAVASFWLIIPTVFIHFASHPVVRAVVPLGFALGFSRSVTSVAGASKFEVFTSMTAYFHPCMH